MKVTTVRPLSLSCGPMVSVRDLCLLIFQLLWSLAVTEFRAASGSIAEDELLREGLARFPLRREDNQTLGLYREPLAE